MGGQSGNQEGILFNSQSLGRLSLEQVISQIDAFVKKAPKRFYKIIIGTDSDASSSAVLVTAVTVWRVGNGAIHFWTKSEPKQFYSLRERIWQEAISSITLAQEVRSRLQEVFGDEFFWDGNEIHVDVGENGPTKDLIDSVVGMIRGYNFQPVIKPYAFGASVVADRHT